MFETTEYSKKMTKWLWLTFQNIKWIAVNTNIATQSQNFLFFFIFFFIVNHETLKKKSSQPVTNFDNILWNFHSIVFTAVFIAYRFAALFLHDRKQQFFTNYHFLYTVHKVLKEYVYTRWTFPTSYTFRCYLFRIYKMLHCCLVPAKSESSRKKGSYFDQILFQYSCHTGSTNKSVNERLSNTERKSKLMTLSLFPFHVVSNNLVLD